MADLCPPDDLSNLTRGVETDPGAQLGNLERLLERYPADARLHFLHGSMLATERRLIEAHRALSKAVELAPDFAIARFQLGLFQLTSGEAANALETWGRLDLLEDGHYLRSFVDGLRCLIRDDFAKAIEHLTLGIAQNTENVPLSRDMNMLIDRIRPLLTAPRSAPGDDTISETSLILSQLGRPKGKLDS